MATPQARQKLRRRIGVRGQVVFHLHRLDRLPRLQTEKSIDRAADIVADAHQACLQRLDVGAIDGFLGLKTRQAVKAMQVKYNLPADSYPTPELLTRLRGGH